jgi:hypothetical protein
MGKAALRHETPNAASSISVMDSLNQASSPLVNCFNLWPVTCHQPGWPPVARHSFLISVVKGNFEESSL